jgi:hypothetical protein
MVISATLSAATPPVLHQFRRIELRLEELIAARSLFEFQRNARRAVERVLLPPWLQEHHRAVEAHGDGFEIRYTDGERDRRLSILRVGEHVEVHCDGELEARLSGVRTLIAEPWVLGSGVLVGVLLELEHERLGVTSLRLRFGSAGGVL